MSLPAPASRRRSPAVLAAAFSCALACIDAGAQTRPEVDAAPGFVPDPGQTDGWRFSLGLGAVSHARFPGSSERRTSVLPIFSVNYGRFFIGASPDAGTPAGIGATLLESGPWRAGIGLGVDLESPRKESDSSRLKGLGDIDKTVSGSAFALYDGGPFLARSSVVTDIGGKGEGTRVNFDLEGRFSPVRGLVLSAGPGLTWADRKYTQTFFGVTAAQSASSGLARYDASSGLQRLRFGVGANYRLSPAWSVGARVTASSLRGDAADSPITEKKTQTSFGLFTSYRF